jgi:NCS1 family nucleobase:cation symporter-1
MLSPNDHQPSSPWTVEAAGLEPIPDRYRQGSARRLFWVWFAGNLSFAYLVIGAVVWSFGLSLWQSLLAIAIGVAAFWAIGYLGLPGRRTGLPTMAYSARYFGGRGNRLMALVSWINLVGWETVVLIIAAYAVAVILHLGFHTPMTPPWLILSLALSALLELCIAFYGHALIEAFQQWISYVFGLLTLLVLLAFVPHIAWHAVISRPPGPWFSGVVPAITIVIAVSALSWVTTASDYTRYLPTSIPDKQLIRLAAWGAVIPTGTLMLDGVLLGDTAPSLASAVNPIQLLMHWMPAWAAIPYLLVTAVGIIAGGIMCAYSSGLSLLAAGITIPWSRTIAVDAVVSLGASLYVLLVSQHFLDSFEAFLDIVQASGGKFDFGLLGT